MVLPTAGFEKRQLAVIASVAGVVAVIVSITSTLLVLPAATVPPTIPVPSQAGPPDIRPAVFQAGRSLLIRGAAEDPGFGLYSYVLFTQRPTDSERPRYIALVYAITRTVERVGDMMSVGVDRSEINVIYFPVTRAPRRGATPMEAAVWIVDNYDYARAEAIRVHCRYARGPGPFLVASLSPLSKATASHQPLIHDLANASDDTLELWAVQFVQTSCIPQAWNETSLAQAALRIRDYLAAIAVSGQPVFDAAEKVLAWLVRVKSK